MNHTQKKSRYHKQSTKSGNEDINSPEEEELKKYRELIEKLGYTCQKNKSKDLTGSHYSDSAEQSNINISSNIRRTTSRTKEAFNDRDFLINFMNDDTMPILPKNMHLLTDDDTNQNIDDKTKFQNLADLLLDDKETIIESHFLKKVEDKMILKLYTALSRRSKDIFMEENNNNEDKKRILLHKLNNIEIPKFSFKGKETINNNENTNVNLKLSEEKDILEENNEEIIENENMILKKMLRKSKKSFSAPKDIQQDNNINISNNTNSNHNNNFSSSKRNSIVKSQNDLNDKYLNRKEKPHFNPRCKYNKKKNKLKIIKLPTLDNFVQIRPYKTHPRKSRKVILPPQTQKFGQWEPDIDGDLLAYINHNIVKIEDIYNKGKENIFELKENLEEEVKPIEAKEVFFDINQNQNNNEEDSEDNKSKSLENYNQSKKSLSNISEDDDLELKNKNKFCEYKDRLPNLIEISLLVEPDKKKISDFHRELQELYANRINEVGEMEEEMFPSFGKDIKSNKIYKFAINNERNEEINTDSFTLLGESTNVSKSQKSKDKSKKLELKLDLGSSNNNLKNKENEKNVSSDKDSMNNKEKNEKNENTNSSNTNKSEEEKNNSEKRNIIYDDDTNNLYSLEENYENDENPINNNNFEDNKINKRDEEEENNIINNDNVLRVRSAPSIRRL